MEDLNGRIPPELYGRDLTGYRLGTLYSVSISTDERTGKDLGYYESADLPLKQYKGQGYFGADPTAWAYAALFPPEGNYAYIMESTALRRVQYVPARMLDVYERAMSKLTPEEREAITRKVY
jgi:hypothetical protein